MDNKYKNDIEYLRKLKDTKDKKNEEIKALNTEIEMLERSMHCFIARRKEILLSN